MKALILLNLGTPDAPKTPEVRRYLRQFLMDPYVVDIPWFFRALLVYGVILPTRPAKSAEAYRKVWTQNGSPLLHYLLALTEKVSKLLGISKTGAVPGASGGDRRAAALSAVLAGRDGVFDRRGPAVREKAYAERPLESHWRFL